MAKLVECKVCKKEVANGARVCPHCGVSEPSTTFKDKFFGWVIVAVVFTVLAGIIMLFN